VPLGAAAWLGRRKGAGLGRRCVGGVSFGAERDGGALDETDVGARDRGARRSRGVGALRLDQGSRRPSRDDLADVSFDDVRDGVA
jgi:hypothetical protein